MCAYIVVINVLCVKRNQKKKGIRKVRQYQSKAMENMKIYVGTCRKR